MKTNDVQKLIDTPLQPNPSEWAMAVEDVLNKKCCLSADARVAIKNTKLHNGVFQNYTDELIAILKRIIKMSENDDAQGDDVIMTNKNIFIVYSQQNVNFMREIKDFIKENLGLEPKTLDIAEHTGCTWNAFTEKSAECQKAVVLMSDDDKVIDMKGNAYKQARPNVFIELGYMIHKCGLNNVTIFYSGECKEASDITGLTSVHYGADKWTESFRKQLSR